VFSLRHFWKKKQKVEKMKINKYFYLSKKRASAHLKLNKQKKTNNKQTPLLSLVHKMPQKKSKVSAAEMARRRAQSARDRKMSNSVVRSSVSAPKAISQTLMSGRPRYQATANGLIVSHSEKFFSVDVADTGFTNYTKQVKPYSFPWLQNIAGEYQHFKIRKINFHYRPRVGTEVGGTVVMAPYYDAQNPWVIYGANGEGFLEFLTSLPGAKQFANWAADSVGFLASNLVRGIFRIIGVNTVPGASAPTDAGYDEAIIPGYICVVCSPRSDGATTSNGYTTAGDIWVDYTVELIAPRGPRNVKGVSIRSTSSTGAALALQSSPMSGNTGFVRPSGTNTLTFEAPGMYCVIKLQTGTTLAMDIDGDIIYDQFNNDVTDARLHNHYDVSAAALSDSNDVSSYDMWGSDGDRIMQAYFVDAQAGDKLIIDAPLSGTLATTMLQVFRCDPAVVVRP
jgi:hypothetical protein